MTNQQDEITKVLKECEETLRVLASQDRLSAGALKAFVQLSTTVKTEMERRRNPDRRETPRGDGDRREETRVATVYQSPLRLGKSETQV